MLSSSSYSLPAPRAFAALSILLLVLLSLALLSGCTDSAANQQSQTPVSTTAAQSQPKPPGAAQTPLSGVPPRPFSSVQPTVDLPDAEATTHARVLQQLGPTATTKPTIDPRIPTSTPVPTSTPGPTFTATPPPVPLTNSVPDPHQQGVQYFPQTGHTLRGVFLDYWNAHGGAGQLGYPITEEFVEYPLSGSPSDPHNNTLDNSVMPVVQYFQQARLALPSGLPLPSDTPITPITPSSASVQETPGGEQLARQKGYFDGLYPRYGYALDFSWIAGIYSDYAAACQTCGRCPLIYFALKNINNIALVLPYGPAWDTSRTAINDTPQAQVTGSGYPYVALFGKAMGDIIANPYGGHAGRYCASTKYLVERAQPNPVQKTTP